MNQNFPKILLSGLSNLSILRGVSGSFYTGRLFLNLPRKVKRLIYNYRFLCKLTNEIRQRLVVGADKNLTVLDCGANIGIWTDIFVTFGYRVVAIEPDPNCYKYLLERFLASECVIVDECALSDKDGKVRFNTGQDLFSQSGYVVDIPHQGQQILEVPSAKLSDYVRRFTPYFVKIDIEGEEVAVINEVIKELSSEQLRCVFFAVETHERKIEKLSHELVILKKALAERGLSGSFSFDWQ